MMRLPLANWTLTADSLPDRLLDAPVFSGFSLPGADALDAFADLLGGDAPAESAQPVSPDAQSAPFSLPGMIPEDVSGCAECTREIDFGSLRGERALLEIDHLTGRGEILLGDSVLARFDSAQPPLPAMQSAAEQTASPCMLAVDLTDALHLGRRETLTLRFDGTRPAGACGPVFLTTTTFAHLSCASLLPDASHRTITLRARICARQAGSYALRAQAMPPAADQGAPAAREMQLTLSEGETRNVSLSMEVSANRFTPGKAYAASAIKLQLFYRPADGRKDGPLCDEALLSIGYPGRDVQAFLPLTAQDCAGDPAALAARLAALHVPAVSLSAVQPDIVYRALCRTGIAVRQFVPEGSAARALLARHANVSLSAAPLADAPAAPEAIAWQLCSLTAFPRAIDETLAPHELLLEAAGRALDCAEPGVQNVLAWLCAVSVCLRAEAARQGRFTDALCAPGALNTPDLCDALETAFAPLHLSALPLCGAWWTGTRFSAALEAFIPEGETRTLTAAAVLEDESGAELARLSKTCTRSSHIGVLEAALPDHPCVLTLSCSLAYDDQILEQSTLPVYVGERGPLEAAFI